MCYNVLCFTKISTKIKIMCLNIAEEPKKFMIEQLERLKKAQRTNIDYPCLFDDTNVQSVFGMLDPTHTGYITLEQYEAGKA